jgi:hypothetical protein
MAEGDPTHQGLEKRDGEVNTEGLGPCRPSPLDD